MSFKVGEIAKRTGLTVRTLHHWEDKGLVLPSHRTDAGHRLYSVKDLARLQQIKSLRMMGLSLAAIGELFAAPDYSPLATIERHVAQIRGAVAEQTALCDRLEGIARAMRARRALGADDFLQTLEMMTMFEKYYTKEQLETLAARREAFGDEASRNVEQEWPQLIAAVRAEMEAGTDPAHERVQALARRWQELIEMFTGGDPGITASLRNLYAGEPQMAQQQGLDPELMRYVQRATPAAHDPNPDD